MPPAPTMIPAVSPSRRRLLRSLPAAALLGTGWVQAQPAWPTRTVRMVVPVGAGGTTDMLPRLLGQALAQTTGQPFVVENKPGGSGAIAAQDVLRSPPDGHTLLVSSATSVTIPPALGVKLPYAPETDFVPIVLMARANSLILAPPNLEANNFRELLALARKRPGYLNHASGGVGSSSHLTFELLKSQAGIFITHIPYKGSSTIMADLASGTIHLATDALPSGLPHVRSGRLKALAVTGDERSPLAPEIPTVAESGVPGFSTYAWFGIHGPKGMPPALVQRINEAFNRELQAPEMAARFRGMGIDPARGSADDFGRMVAADRARWERLVRERNIKPE